jgi:phosphoserine phosphatase
MLAKTETAIAFNPSKQLFVAAKKNGWRVVVERKNVIYKLSAKNDGYELDE